MRNVVQRHFPDVFHYSVNIDQSIFISLDHAHVTSGEVGEQHPECNRDKQQRFVLLLDTQIKQYECDCIHDQELRFSNNVAERSHFIQILKYLVHYCIVINMSSSETVSPPA